MEKFAICVLNGKIWIDRAVRYWRSSFTLGYVKIFWPVYAFWVSYLTMCVWAWFPGTLPPALYILYGDRIDHTDEGWIWPFAPETVYNVAIFFFDLSYVFFFLCCGACIYYLVRRKFKISLAYAVYIGLILIFLYPVFILFKMHFGMYWLRFWWA